jgi:hypothetical protein
LTTKHSNNGNEPPGDEPIDLVRPLPSGSKWAFALGLLVLIAGFFLAGWLSSPWPVFIPIATLVLYGLWSGIRCPQCHRRMHDRKAPIHGGPTYRLFYECKQCEALWDSGRVIDPTAD